MVKNLSTSAGSIPGSGRSPGEGNGTHSSIFAWEISWAGEPGRLQSMGLQRVRHDLATKTERDKDRWSMYHLKTQSSQAFSHLSPSCHEQTASPAWRA